MSALVLSLSIVEIEGQFLWKTVDYIIYTNFLHLKVVQSASAGQTKVKHKTSQDKEIQKWARRWLTLNANNQGNPTTKSVLTNKIDETWAKRFTTKTNMENIDWPNDLFSDLFFFAFDNIWNERKHNSYRSWAFLIKFFTHFLFNSIGKSHP